MKKYIFFYLLSFIFISCLYGRSFSVQDCIDGSTFVLDTTKLSREEEIPKETFLEMFLPRIQDFPREEQHFILKYINIIWDETNKTGNDIASQFLNECIDKKF